MNQSSNREVARTFLNLVVSGKVREAYNKHVSEDFVHHNPYFKGDRESLLVAMDDDAIKNPNKKLEIKLTLEDGDLVTTYSHIWNRSGNDEFAAVHIFRIKNNQIVELWDVAHVISEVSPNKHGMF